MVKILKATKQDAYLLAKIGKQTFLESHGKSASKSDIYTYISTHFTEDTFKTELQNTGTVFYIIYYKNLAVGYSKISYNSPVINIPFSNVSKLERLYILQAFHHLKIGHELFHYNVKISKAHKQAGLWLYVWTENHRALHFYKKVGFKIIGSYDFKISETHANPNHQMFLLY